MRTFLTTVHRWAGLSVALFLIVAGLTGAVTSWDHELDEWLNQDLYLTDSRGAFKDPMVLAAAVEAADPRAKVSYISLNFEAGHTAGYWHHAVTLHAGIGSSIESSTPIGARSRSITPRRSRTSVAFIGSFK